MADSERVKTEAIAWSKCGLSWITILVLVTVGVALTAVCSPIVIPKVWQARKRRRQIEANLRECANRSDRSAALDEDQSKENEK